MITHEIDKHGIIKITFAGNILYKDIIDWLAEFSTITNLPDQISLLYDFRNAVLLIDAVKLIQITIKTEQVTKKFERVRTVFLIEESAKSAYSILMSFLDVNGKTTRNLYTNYDKAMEWLMSEKTVTL